MSAMAINIAVANGMVGSIYVYDDIFVFSINISCVGRNQCYTVGTVKNHFTMSIFFLNPSHSLISSNDLFAKYAIIYICLVRMRPFIATEWHFTFFRSWTYISLNISKYSS